MAGRRKQRARSPDAEPGSNVSWSRGRKGHGGEGYSKGYGGSGGTGTGPSGPEIERQPRPRQPARRPKSR